MPIVTCDMTISLDGFISGPNHLDYGFMSIMDWIHQTMVWRERYGLEGGDAVDQEALAKSFANVGAFVMGRTMFETGEEPWGDTPPFHAPVFVVTHRHQETLAKNGGTEFSFVTEDLVRVMELAKAAAGEKNVHISGGASLVRQVLNAGLIDELRLHIAPVLLGAGMPLFTSEVSHVRTLELIHISNSPRAVHLTYRRADKSAAPA